MSDVSGMTFRDRLMGSLSAIVLIGANLVPLWGVIWGGWSTFSVVFLFWLENVIIGVLNVFKMLVAAFVVSEGITGRYVTVEGQPIVVLRVLKVIGGLFMAAFFTVHYGMFCFVHGAFVVGLLGGSFQNGSVFGSLGGFIRDAFSGDLRWAVLALLGSHLFSFLWNFIKGGEYRRLGLQPLMGAPYGRVVVLHLAIIAGAFLSMSLGSGMGVLVVLVLLKIILDVKLHLRERSKSAG